MAVFAVAVGAILPIAIMADVADRPLWSGDPAAARPLLTALAAWRAQRCVSLP